MTGFAAEYLTETLAIIRAIDAGSVDRLAHGLAGVRERGGRLFVLGVGGSAGHASHAVNDFRKICGFEAYAPTDNVSELTARINDEGWDSCFSSWLEGSRLGPLDGVLVFSVGGGDIDSRLSTNIIRAVDLGRAREAFVGGVVGRNGGHTARVADVCVVIPPIYASRVTPHTEGICAVIWHLLVSHPALLRTPTTWETVSAAR